MKSLKHLNKFLYKYRYRLILGFAFITISNIFTVYPAQLTRHAIDFAGDSISIYNLTSGFPQKSSLFEKYSSIFLVFLLLIIVSVLLKGLFMFFMRQTIIVTSRLIEYDLKNEIFAHYQVLDLSFFKRNNTGDLMARISEDVGQVRMYLGPAIMYTLNLLVLFIVAISAMISVNAELTLYVLIPLPLMGIGVYYVSMLINQKSDRVQKQVSRLSTFVQESFSGIRVLKAFAREEAYRKSFLKENEKYREFSLDMVRTDSFFQPVIAALIGLSTILTIYIGGRQAILGEITIGNIAEFVLYVNMLTWPVASVGWVTSLVQRAAASQARINEFLNTEPSIKNTSSNHHEIRGEIAFANVSFTYPESGVQALKNVTFTVEPGHSLGIIGRTGSGKSTIAELITRMYDVGNGSVIIDGFNIRNFDLYQLRKNTGYVPQEVFLFSDTIENNIRFGLDMDEVSREKVEAAARDAAIYSNIMEFPSGFETFIGERGITLSGGQKQRISIARAIIRNPGILIFDDCLSAVDTATEEEILRNLTRIMKGKTSVIISHRISTVMGADKILVLDNGEIREQGTHRDLLEMKGLYFDFYSKQLMEEQDQIQETKPKNS